MPSARNTRTMSIPELVQSSLDDEQVAAEVDLGGEDALYVTPTRTLVYRAEGLLADETVEEYPHDAERVEVSEGRRKSKLVLDYGLDGERVITLPSGRLDDALHPVLAGVMNAAGITESGETVEKTFRFSELTLVVTSARVVKHVGTDVWDEDYEEYAFDDVTDLDFEEGNVATTAVLTVGGRQERFKTPNDEARAVREALTAALLAHYDADSLPELRRRLAPDDDGDDAESGAGADADFGGPDALDADPTELDETPDNATRSDDDADPSEETTAAFEDLTLGADGDAAEGSAAPTQEPSPDAAVAATEDLAAEVAELRALVEQQSEQLDRQAELIEQLIRELRQGR
jgi:hypothetical protein